MGLAKVKEACYETEFVKGKPAQVVQGKKVSKTFVIQFC